MPACFAYLEAAGYVITSFLVDAAWSPISQYEKNHNMLSVLSGCALYLPPTLRDFWLWVGMVSVLVFLFVFGAFPCAGFRALCTSSFLELIGGRVAHRLELISALLGFLGFGAGQVGPLCRSHGLLGWLLLM